MSNHRSGSPGRLLYVLCLVLVFLSGVGAAVAGVLQMWSAAVVCLGAATVVGGVLLFVQNRRQVRTLRIALRRAIDSGIKVSAPPPAPAKETPAQINREIISLLARNNRQLVALSESLPGAATVADGAASQSELQTLATEVAVLRGDLVALTSSLSELTSTTDQRWGDLRADLHALALSTDRRADADTHAVRG